MSRVNDIVFIFSGGKKFSETFPVQDEFNIDLWFANEKKLSYRRRILAESRGADDIPSNLKAVMASIATNLGPLNMVGQVCLLGRSAGCLLALAVAAELNASGVAELTFVGLSDVPMYHDGNNPKVPHVGAIKPQNSPIGTGATAPQPSKISRNIKPVSEIPLAKLDKEIKVKQNNKINLYQIQGNHMKYVNARSEWTWFADSSIGGEVHGKLDDSTWDNQLKVVKGGRFTDDDLDFHVNLNTGQDWKDMCKKAAQEFATLPPQPAP